MINILAYQVTEQYSLVFKVFIGLVTLSPFLIIAALKRYKKLKKLKADPDFKELTSSRIYKIVSYARLPLIVVMMLIIVLDFSATVGRESSDNLAIWLFLSITLLIILTARKYKMEKSEDLLKYRRNEAIKRLSSNEKYKDIPHIEVLGTTITKSTDFKGKEAIKSSPEKAMQSLRTLRVILKALLPFIIASTPLFIVIMTQNNEVYDYLKANSPFEDAIESTNNLFLYANFILPSITLLGWLYLAIEKRNKSYKEMRAIASPKVAKFTYKESYIWVPVVLSVIVHALFLFNIGIPFIYLLSNIPVLIPIYALILSPIYPVLVIRKSQYIHGLLAYPLSSRLIKYVYLLIALYYGALIAILYAAFNGYIAEDYLFLASLPVLLHINISRFIARILTKNNPRDYNDRLILIASVTLVLIAIVAAIWVSFALYLAS